MMKQYEYFQETVESISDDNWSATLAKHGNQSWELVSIMGQDTYKKLNPPKADEKVDEEPGGRQTIYVAIFKRAL